MATKANAQVVKPETTVEVQANVEPTSEMYNSTYREIIKQLVANGAKKINAVRVKNVTVTDCDSYTRVALTLANPVDGFVYDEASDSWSKGKTSVVFTSVYAIAGMLKEAEETAWCANHIVAHPEVLNLVLCGSDVTLLQRSYEEGEEIRNPFTTRDDVEGVTYDHDVIINDVIDIKLGKTAEKMLDKLADKMLGF